MSTEEVWKQFSSLPREGQQEVAGFVAFLRAQYTSRARRKTVKGSVANEPFVGMWRDREDMADSTAWVRETRLREWSRTRNE